MLLGVIADDFTGASDIANTLVKGTDKYGGMKTSLYLGIPDHPAADHVEAGVVALKNRSIPVNEAVEQSLAALDWLLEQGAQQIVFKYCSTFDSTPEGNIGQVAESLAARLGVKGVVVCPAFPTAGRTVYQGHLFVNGSLLNESGLQNHPLNPMTDPYIPRWLKMQSKDPVGLLPLDTVSNGKQAIIKALKNASNNGETLIVADAVSDQNLLTLGNALADARLITGGSGIAIGLPGNFHDAGMVSSTEYINPSVNGPEAILAGSCSSVTRRQIKIHAEKFPVLAVDAEKVLNRETTVQHLVDFIRHNSENAPLIYSSNAPEKVANLQERYGPEKIACELENLFASTAIALIESGVRKLVVAGGETSGAVVTALNPGSFTVGREIDPGVPALYCTNDKNYGIVLKSGNFGADDFFEKALRTLSEGSSPR